MGKNYLDKKTIEKANKRLESAIKNGYIKSKFWQDEIAKIEKITGKNIMQRKNIAVGASRLTKGMQEYLNREFAHIATSKYGTRYGFQKAKKKQQETLVKEGYVSSVKEARRFQKIISSDIFQKVMDNLTYISYLDAYSLAQEPNATLKNIENAYNEVEKMNITEQEKADRLLDLIKKG